MFSWHGFKTKIFGVIILLILGAMAFLPYLSSHQTDTALAALKIVSDKERAYNAVLSQLKDAETGQRGFLLGNDESFLEPYNNAHIGLPRALQDIAQLANTREEKAIVARIADLSKAKLVVMEKTIVLKREGKARAAIELVASGQGRIIMDELRKMLGAQLDKLSVDRATLGEEVSDSLRDNVALGIGASLASLVIIGTAALLSAHSMKERAEATKQARLMAETNAGHAAQSVLRAERLTVTAQMLQALDSVSSPGELEQIAPVFLRKLFPGSSGAIYLYRNSRDFLELKARWGAEQALDELISPGDCWGLRLGKLHDTADSHDLCCSHGIQEVSGNILRTCVPMISQGDVIGLVVLNAPKQDSAPFERDLILAVSEQLSLAISNLSLRETLRRQSTVDPLTGLYNRRYFDEAFKRELVRANRSGDALSIVMVDLDHFKRINDTYGHDGGDLVLSAAAKAVSGRVRASDIVCRYGGEELVLLLAECNAEDAAKCAEKIRQSLRAVTIKHSGTTITGITASFGIAAWPTHSEDASGLIKAADEALYAAKKSGRDRVVIASNDDMSIAHS